MNAKRLRHIDANACDLGELHDITVDQLCICEAHLLRRDLNSLIEILKLLKLTAAAAKQVEPMESEDWSALVIFLTHCLGSRFEAIRRGDWLSQASEDDRLAVAAGFHRADRALSKADLCVDGNSGPTGIVLPASLGRRIAVLLQGRALPLAWIRQVDLYGGR